MKKEKKEAKKVSVPLRGVGCFISPIVISSSENSFSPLAGCGLFLCLYVLDKADSRFQSPCGVWVVSGKNVDF